MERQTAAQDPLEILFQQYNQGKIASVGFRSFTLRAGESSRYKTLKSALIVPVSGQAVFSFENEPFLAKRGLFLHGCPGRTLTISVLDEQDFRYINMYYENERCLLFARKLKHTDKTIGILEQILKLAPEQDVREQYLLEQLKADYFAEIFSDFQPEPVYGESQLMCDLLDYIAAHYAEPITLDRLAEHVNEKPAHISYLFYKYKKIRPIDYVINYRVRIAAGLLRSGRYTVAEVARLVGYKDACYFSRIFKKRASLPPNRLIP